MRRSQFEVGLRIMRDDDEQKRAGIAHPVLDPAKFADLNIDRETWTLDETALAARARPAAPLGRDHAASKAPRLSAGQIRQPHTSEAFESPTVRTWMS